MKRFLMLVSATLLLQTFASAASADDAMKKAIGARQAQMKLYSFNLGQLGAMAKGALPYDAKVAQTAADNLLTMATMNNGAAWVKGSGADNFDLEGLTRAKPEIWSTYPKVAELGKALAKAATGMAATAGNGVDGIKASIGAVGGACKECHKAFRVPKK